MTVVTLPIPRARKPSEAGGEQPFELSEALREAVRGEVRFDPGSRAVYSTDASNYRQVPIGVVIPRDIDDVVAAVEVCRRYDAPVFSRGGGTSLGGQCTNVAVMLDLAKYVNAVESVDAEHRTAVVQAGIVLDELNKATRPHGLVFGPKPATHDHCTIGGMLGNNSCGSTAQWSGTTAANVRRMEVLTYDGVRMWVGPTSDEEYQRILDEGGRRAEIYRQVHDLRDAYLGQIRTGYPQLPRRISGYNLPDLLPENGFNLARALVGSESTCVTILRAELDLLPEPTHVALLLAGYDDIASAADRVPLVNEHHPYILEGLDNKLIEYERDRRMNTVALHELPPAGAWLMVKLTGESDEEARTRAEELRDALDKDGGLRTHRLLADPEHQAELDSVREAALGATARVPGMADTWPGWEDSAVPPERVGDYLRDLGKLLDEYGYGAASLYGHFGHGCVHTSIPFDLVTAAGIADFRSFVTRAAHLVVTYGGSLSGEHGDGQARGELLPIMYGEDLVRAFGRFKAIFDPAGRMNPGKVIDPNPLDGQLRLGTDYAPPVQRTHFEYPDDGGFAGVPTRCFGVGACRRHDSDAGVMCPSYQVTREEQHSTRGRMRLLFEMMRGETIRDGWRSREVHEALDLCLACKGCKSDCPVSVDMATYKAEFLAHHYTGRIRPRAHYSLGWLPLWARLAAPAPWAANLATHAPGLGRLAKRAAGVDPQRDVPRFAPRRFTDAFRRRGSRGSGKRGRVVLWPDTFSNSFDPGIPAAAVTVLEAAGYRVVVPQDTVCCGLTWISTGQLDIAKRVLRRSLRTLAPMLRDGLPVVGLEPSCTSVLREDAVNLLGAGDLDAVRLRQQTRTLAELLDEDAPDFAPRLPELTGGATQAIVQTHCHQHATLGNQADRRVMERIGLDARVLDSGCCGLAGDFGMTPEHRDVSLACAERVLLPEVRDADPDTLILADGFSCRTQIHEAGTWRRPRHLAEVLAAAVGAQRPGWSATGRQREESRDAPATVERQA
ncbi:FAD-binding and (Fe-S)-binding domain-containing protein [Rugosimonospora africana]|uniref:Dimethylmenaquinone methyltransferase n=1 Tax=Rugosimonospora africana TaxID=556532 RepID=A0A8J3VUS5_9ACTN|nr:FAD-binding and (Fe-S)-binding domain-containing protein [Rugosimonospora africana]GIH19902.1 dimethylmenaquinone methyltransferase [Rugosimonospora africana]